MKKIKLNTAKLQLTKEKIMSLSGNEFNQVGGGYQNSQTPLTGGCWPATNASPCSDSCGTGNLGTSCNGNSCGGFETCWQISCACA